MGELRKLRFCSFKGCFTVFEIDRDTEVKNGSGKILRSAFQLKDFMRRKKEWLSFYIKLLIFDRSSARIFF